MRTLSAAVLLCLPLLTGNLAAQHVISTKAGLINLIQGDVKLNDEAIVVRNSRYAEMKNGDVLRAGEGRAEVLLAPGAFIRISENSAFRMESNSLSNTRLALLEGSALLEVMEFTKDSSLELLIGTEKISVQKAGLYRLNAEDLSLKVYDGELAVISNDVLRKVGEGKVMTLTGDHLIAKFDRKTGDEFSRWASRRSSHIAMANISAAKDTSLLSSGLTRSGWIFNPWYGFYTYVPYGRTFYSPFGYGFYSPNTVYAVLMPQSAPTWGSGNTGTWGGGGGFGGGPTMGGFDRGSMRGGSMSGGGFSGAAPSAGAPSVGGAERASGGAAEGGARGGGGGARGNQ